MKRASLALLGAAACGAALAFLSLAACGPSSSGAEGRSPASAEARKSLPDSPPVKLLVIGPTLGFLEPCGCAGGQIGGLSRRGTLLDLELARDPSLVVLDAGTLVRGGGVVEKIRGESVALAYGQLPVDAVGLGPFDLAAGVDEAALRAQIHGRPSVLTGVSVPAPIAGSHVAKRVLFLSVIPGDEGSSRPAIPHVREELARHRGSFDVAVAVVYGTRDQARELTRSAPELDVVVVARGSGSPDSKPEAVDGALVFHAGERGRELVRIEGARRNGRFVADRYVVETVLASIPPSPEIEPIVRGYAARLEQEQVVSKLAGTLDAPEGGFAGSDACIGCHTQEHEIWQTTKHAHGVQSLVESKDRPKGHFDPDCLKCHAVGWFNEEGRGYATGYDGNPESPLASIGCESCHGAALKHTKAPLDLKLRPRRDIDCRQCHDSENSPKFDRATFWLKIQHGKGTQPVK
jgi:cytochrome c554/c'-like protein